MSTPPKAPTVYQITRVLPPQVAGHVDWSTITFPIQLTDTTRSGRVAKAATDEPLAAAKKAAAESAAVVRFRGLMPQVTAADVAAKKAAAGITAAKAHLELVEAEAGVSPDYLAQRDAALQAVADAEKAADKAATDAAHIEAKAPKAWESAEIAVRLAVSAAQRERYPDAEKRVADARERLDAKVAELAPLLDEWLTAVHVRDGLTADPPKDRMAALVEGLIGHKPFAYPAPPKPAAVPQASVGPVVQQMRV